ncbi:type II secretion system protein M [Vibrio cortegadensis]|uniref:type II secretion system protein M n=1 Tax=Vibrio cortegadensis TaxID=1328770 RepID=UPI0021C416A1|nr:type II secretion system protein M [Vibrio cortegadensis]MDN3697648.1 type II secretion system protein M [Vibrio cortegadensis]
MKNLLSLLQTWWTSISQREQRLVIGCSVLLTIGVIYWGLLQPLNVRAEQAQLRITSEKQLLSWVENKADEIVALRSAGGIKVSNQPLNQIISSSTRGYKIELIRVQPRNEMLQVWIKPVPFNQFLSWIAYLKDQKGVEVEFMDIDRSEKPGVIDVNRLQFKRGN